MSPVPASTLRSAGGEREGSARIPQQSGKAEAFPSRTAWEPPRREGAARNCTNPRSSRSRVGPSQQENSLRSGQRLASIAERRLPRDSPRPYKPSVTHSRSEETLLNVVEESVLRELTDGGERRLGVNLGLGNIGGRCGKVHAAQSVLLLADLELGGIEIVGLRLSLV